jgi:hypothetical protein
VRCIDASGKKERDDGYEDHIIISLQNLLPAPFNSGLFSK